MVMMVAAVAVMPIWLRKCAGREEREQDNYQIFLHVRTVTNPTMIVCAIKLSFLIITRQPIGPSQGHPGAKFLLTMWLPVRALQSRYTRASPTVFSQCLAGNFFTAVPPAPKVPVPSLSTKLLSTKL
jgi:hypothetical protein